MTDRSRTSDSNTSTSLPESISANEAAAVGIEIRRTNGVLLASQVDKEIDRLKEGQLPAGADAAKDSGLFTDKNRTAFDALDVPKKRSSLKVIAKRRTAADELSKVSQYLDKLKAIPIQ